MYTYCTIKFIDDDSEEDVIIKSDEEIDPKTDDEIFFYGLPFETVCRFCREGTVVEGEWVVTAVDGCTNALW